jgi:hypothetical protein
VSRTIIAGKKAMKSLKLIAAARVTSVPSSSAAKKRRAIS